MKKMNVEVSLYPVTIDLEAKVGDQIMILDGRVIGVFTGQSAKPSPQGDKLIKKLLTGAKPKPAKKINRENMTLEQKQKITQDILQAIRMRPGATLQELRGLLGYPPGSIEERRTQYWVVALAKQGKIEALPSGTGNIFNYKLAA